MIHFKDNFLNEEQKKLKQKIMEGLIDGLFGKIHVNLGSLLDEQSASDMLTSCIIMFTRECIVHFVRGSNMNDNVNHRVEVVDGLLSIIRKEIMNKLLDA